MLDHLVAELLQRRQDSLLGSPAVRGHDVSGRHGKAGYLVACYAVAGGLPPEAVELPEPRPAQERLPLPRGECQRRAVRVLGVADRDAAFGQAGHLDAVAVAVAEG